MRFKHGFTLAETLIVFVIVGIIASMTIAYVKPWDKTYKHIYSRIYAALNKSIYNDIVEQAKFPGTNQEFCEALFRWMNTPETSPCADMSKIELGKTPTDANFADPNKPGVTLTNGSTIYIGSDTGGIPFVVNIHKYNATDPDIPLFQFFLVYVDLNGKARKPNYMCQKNASGACLVLNDVKNLPDIVAFAVTQKGSVIPLGAPQYDIRFLQAHLVEPAPDIDSDDIISDPVAYRTAQIKAYGTITGVTGDGGTADNATDLVVSNNDHYTYSDDIVNVLGWCSGSSKHPFCVNWQDSNIYGAAAFYKADGTPVTFNETVINENCKVAGCPNCDTSCYVKIYDYH